VIAAAILIISKVREQAKVKAVTAPAAAPPAGNQSGCVIMRLLIAMFLTASIAAIGYGLMGCAPNQTAIQQIAAQTSDPGTIALATYADALQAYVDAQESD
jgi:hypothetical protein